MDQHGRDRAFFDLRQLILAFPAAHDVDEVREPGIPGVRFRFRTWRLLRAHERLPSVAGRGQISLRSVPDVADRLQRLPFPAARRRRALADACLVVRDPVADFEGEQLLLPSVLELERHQLRVRRLLIVVEQIVPAHRADLGRVLHAECRARRMDLMGALVADVAVAVVPLPVPVVVEAILRERLDRRRAGPEIVRDARRHRFFFRATDRVAPLEDEPARHVDVADEAFSDLLLRFVEPQLRAGAVLHDPVVLPRRRDDLLRLEHVVRDRLFDEDILAGLDRPDRLQRVVEVWRGDRDRVDRLVVEQPPEVSVGGRPLFPRGLDGLDAAVDDRLIDVAQRGDLDVGHLEIRTDVRLAAAVESDDGDPDGVVRTLDRARFEGCWQRDGTHEEMPSIDVGHHEPPI